MHKFGAEITHRRNNEIFLYAQGDIDVGHEGHGTEGKRARDKVKSSVNSNFNSS